MSAVGASIPAAFLLSIPELMQHVSPPVCSPSSHGMVYGHFHFSAPSLYPDFMPTILGLAIENEMETSMAMRVLDSEDCFYLWLIVNGADQTQNHEHRQAPIYNV